jgi:DNA-binding CsgD family transcriptional regulator
MERAAPNGHGIANAIGEWAIALLDLGTGQHSPAMTRLQALAGAPPGQSHPLYVLISAPDLVEACVRCGDMDAAATALGVLRGFDRPGAPGWARALDARCRALLAKPEDAERAFTDALRYHEGGNPFDRARTQLLYGEFLRRQKRRVDAREQLRSALSEFERLRAEPWAERSRGELRASGETARKRDPSSIDHLTPQEMQIARLVGEGLSNKEAAAQLFLSPRTVDYHLRNVFAKLGITSRSELIRQRVMASPEPAAASS